MAKIFVSYSHKDRKFVQRLARDLRSQAVDVWLDDVELQVGDDFAKELDEAVATNDFLGVVVSTNSIASEWVNRELKLALVDEASQRRTKVLPIVIDDCALPSALAKKVYADFTNPGDYFVALSRLLRPMGVTKSALELKAEIAPSVAKRWSLRMKSSDFAVFKVVVIGLAAALVSAIGMKFFATMAVVIDGPLAAAKFTAESSLGFGGMLAISALLDEENPLLGVVAAGLVLGLLGFLVGLLLFLFEVAVSLQPREQLWTASAVGGLASAATFWLWNEFLGG